MLPTAGAANRKTEGTRAKAVRSLHCQSEARTNAGNLGMQQVQTGKMRGVI